MAAVQKKSCWVGFDGTTVLTCGSNSALVQETAAPSGSSNIHARTYQGLDLSSASKAALYDCVKAKDCLCSGEQRDGGPGSAATPHSPSPTWGLPAALSACFSSPNRSQEGQDLTSILERWRNNSSLPAVSQEVCTISWA